MTNSVDGVTTSGQGFRDLFIKFQVLNFRLFISRNQERYKDYFMKSLADDTFAMGLDGEINPDNANNNESDDTSNLRLFIFHD